MTRATAEILTVWKYVGLSSAKSCSTYQEGHTLSPMVLDRLGPSLPPSNIGRESQQGRSPGLSAFHDAAKVLSSSP